MDQRGWFYSLLAISTLIFNKAPYKNVIVMGHVQDENGQKMSKSKGNAVDPFDALETYGADAIRWYFLCKQRAMAAQPIPRQGRNGRTEKVHGYPLEYLCIFRVICKYR